MKAELTEKSIEWVNTLPPTWNVKRLDSLASVKARLGWKGLKAEEYVKEGYIFLSTPNLKGDDIDFENVNYITKARYDESPEIMLREGDVLMVKDGATLGIVALVKSLPAPATVNGSTAVIRSTNDCDSRFLYHWLRSRGIQQLIEKMKGGMGVPHLFQSDLRRFPVALPPISEQRRIAAYLDEQTEKIDRLMDMRRRQMALLKEQRSALIQQAVTCGLNSNVPMKDSGLPWLGEIPEHWHCAPLRRFWEVIDCKHLTVPFLNEGYPLASVSEVQSFELDLSQAKRTSEEFWKSLIEGERQPRPGDLIYCRNTSVGAAAYVSSDEPIAMGQDVCLIRSSGQNGRYLNHLLRSGFMTEQLNTILVGATFKRINVADIKALIVLCPSKLEQDDIVDLVDSESTKVDALHAAYDRQLTILTEYRAALIHECVTGQRLIPEAASL